MNFNCCCFFFSGFGDDCISKPVIFHSDVVDCGPAKNGTTCAFTCQNGFSPSGNLTCLSGNWDLAKCGSCSDGEQSGDETGIDCGGSCGIDSCRNCFFFFCSNNHFSDVVSATCLDGIRNGDETGIDCGGSCGIICRDIISFFKKNKKKNIITGF